MQRLPVLAQTMGDPNGVGPEILLKARLEAPSPGYHPVAVGDAAILAALAARLGWPVRVRAVPAPPAGGPEPGVLDVIDLQKLPLAAWRPGALDAAAGGAAVAYVREAVRLALAGAVDAVVTAPLHKEAMRLAGHPQPGHTELLAELTGAGPVRMVLVTPTLRVIHVSTHVSLREAIRRVTKRRVLETIAAGDAALRQLGEERRHIAVSGLNPHAGEHGLFGREDAAQIAPAVAAAQARGIDAHGPLPPDTVFYRASRGEFDLVVAMYHDQGHIPVKLGGLDAGVNWSVGLPIIRTSVDHGTAFDIAGTGRASAQSLHAASDLAARLALAWQAAGDRWRRSTANAAAPSPRPRVPRGGG